MAVRHVNRVELTLEDFTRQALSRDGPLSHALPGFEPRPQQLRAATAIARALQENRTVLLEVPTGGGKSLSALVPLAFHLREDHKRAVYSTATITLQEQLVRKDVPTVQHALGGPTAGLLKGMGRYLCLVKWAELRDRLATAGGDPHVQAFDRWVSSTQTGDQAELLSVPHWWGEVAADHSDCLGPACSAAQACFALKARERARSAQLAIANHHLTMAYLRYRSSVIPDDATIVFDEAHRLADIATDMLGDAFTSNSLPSIARRLHGLAPRGDDPLHHMVRTALALHERFIAALRLRPGQEAGNIPDSARPAAAALLEALQQIAATIRSRPWDVLRDRSGTSPNDRAAIALRAVENYMASLSSAIAPPSGVASWIEPRASGLSVHTAPVDIGAVLGPRLFSGTGPRILMSATLSTAGTFSHIRTRLGIRHADEVTVSPVFDYARQMRYYFPSPPLDPNRPDFTARVTVELRSLLVASRGRALVLFTSYAQLRQVADSLRDLPYTLIVQDETTSAAAVELFRSDVHSVMFATSRMWEGIDVPGQALSLLVVVRLPFEVPTHPLARARYEAARQAGQNPFQTVVLPEAITRMRQGVGRLIRSATDRGVVAILDGRVLTRPYGRRFLAALPQAPTLKSLDEVARFPAPGGHR